ncbi:hypothetical protein M427DRAFT_69852 [Gonapodya prolifera JEL478]|uniref:Uncharacterized protein n=1 Tax=Gonapodya prolifera (strain JEL478) TaxID=1344416 RepID=A0A139AFY3_GONPJ|nr:hypothetical protein M427DRAFT_69852 [Gonapodya prolifera JEL478]|eukprot:KXS15732.1 hypothetical protein M427DRAFT_69852 [Gonapodya prolifera JEL478]
MAVRIRATVPSWLITLILPRSFPPERPLIRDTDTLRLTNDDIAALFAATMAWNPVRVVERCTVGVGWACVALGVVGGASCGSEWGVRRGLTLPTRMFVGTCAGFVGAIAGSVVALRVLLADGAFQARYRTFVEVWNKEYGPADPTPVPETPNGGNTVPAAGAGGRDAANVGRPERGPRLSDVKMLALLPVVWAVVAAGVEIGYLREQ